MTCVDHCHDEALSPTKVRFLFLSKLDSFNTISVQDTHTKDRRGLSTVIL